MTHGWNDGQFYYIRELSVEFSGFPDDPHIILSLDSGRSKSYQTQTDKGFGPRESYFKLINKEVQDD